MATSRSKLVIREDGGSGEFEWALIVRGKVIVQSAKNYKTRGLAKQSAEALVRNIQAASIVEE